MLHFQEIKTEMRKHFALLFEADVLGPTATSQKRPDVKKEALIALPQLRVTDFSHSSTKYIPFSARVEAL